LFSRGSNLELRVAGVAIEVRKKLRLRNVKADT
jgi:hypothetical protein